MPQLAVIAVGADRPGIVAAVTRELHERGGNLEDSAMTILGGHFAIVLLVDSTDEPDALRDALASSTSELGLSISVTRADGAGGRPEPTHLLSVYGADRPGIVAAVAAAIADAGANITDLQTQVAGGGDEPIYVMVIELEAPAEAALETRVAEACVRLDVDHTLRRIDAETY